MTTPQKKTMKNEKKSLKEITFNVTQTKTTSFTLDYDSFVNYYMNDMEYNGIMDDNDFNEICQEIWQRICVHTDKYDEIELDEADCDDDVDEDFVDEASHDYINEIIEEYKTHPNFKRIVEKSNKARENEIAMIKAKTEEEIKKQKKIAELTAELEKLRSS